MAAPSIALRAYLEALLVPNLSFNFLTLSNAFPLFTIFVAAPAGIPNSVTKEVRSPTKLSGLSPCNDLLARSSILFILLVSNA